MPCSCSPTPIHTCSTCIKPSRALTRFGCLCSAFSAVCFRPAAFKQPQHPAPPPRAFPVPPQQLCCRCVTRHCHKCPAVTPPHTARACRVHAPRRPFTVRLAASSQLLAVHCYRRRLPARRPVCGTLRVLGHHCRKRACSKPPQEPLALCEAASMLPASCCCAHTHIATFHP